MGSTSVPTPGSVPTGTIQNQVWGDQHVHGDQIFNASSDAAQRPVRDCLRSLAYPKMNDRSNAIGFPTGGTCEWLLRHKQWKNWTSSQRGLLWIKGKPGSGKSTLLQYALHELKSTKAAKKALILSFFFHGRGHDLQRNPLGLFRSLLHQVLSEMPDVLTKLVATFEQRRDGIGRPGADWVWELDELHKLFKWSILDVLKSRPVWIFVDALDECGAENAKAVIRHFRDLLQGPPARSQLHICFTCRHYPVQNWEGGFEICTEHENRHDILTYIRAELSGFQCPATQSLPELITERSNGLFIWARLVVDQILDLELADDSSSADEMISTTIDTLPQDLDDLYVELVRGMEETPASLKLLQWISCARRPLSLDELRWAMAINPDLPHISLQDYKSTPDYVEDNDVMERRVKTLSRGLVETIASSNTRIVQFIHQSVKDFFDTRAPEAPEEDFGDGSYSITEVAHYRLYRTCIHYLAMKEITQLPNRSQLDYEQWYNLDRAALLSDYPLLSYATTSWITHLEGSQKSRQVGSRHFYWPSEVVLEQWGKTYRIVDEKSLNRPPHPATLVHVLARHHLVVALQILLSQGDPVDINARDCYGRSPLLYAAERGYPDIVQVLLEAGAEVDPQDLSGAAPLHWAAFKGYMNTMTLLLTKGADAELKDKGGCTPLVWAIEGRKEASIKMLLEKDPDLNYEYVLLYAFKDRPMPSASAFGPFYNYWFYGVDCAWRLYPDRKLGACDPLNVPWIPQKGPCWVWTWRYHPSWWYWIGGPFVRNSDDPVMGTKRKDGTYGDRTPLLRAVELGIESLVTMLLAKGADPDFECSNGWSPMSLAKTRRNDSDKRVVKLFKAHQSGSTP